MCRMSTATGRLPIGAHEQWTVTDAAELYEIDRWGKGYFSISDAGHVLVHPTKDPQQAIDLNQLAVDLQRGLTAGEDDPRRAGTARRTGLC